MTAVNNTSYPLKSVCVVQFTSCCFCLHKSTLAPARCCLIASCVLLFVWTCWRGGQFSMRLLVCHWCMSPNMTPGASVTHSFPLCSPCISKVCRIGVRTGLSGAKGISAAVGQELLTRSKSLWSNFIIGSINLTSLSLGQTERDGGQYNKPNESKPTLRWIIFCLVFLHIRSCCKIVRF